MLASRQGDIESKTPLFDVIQEVHHVQVQLQWRLSLCVLLGMRVCSNSYLHPIDVLLHL